MDRDFADTLARESEGDDRPSTAPAPTEAPPAARAERHAPDGAAAGEDLETGADPYLARAMRVAAEAKARTARIRSGQAIPASQARPAPVRIQWVAPPAPVLPAPGLSVAEAAAASRVPFKPLRDLSSKPAYLTEYRPFEPEPPVEAVPEVDLKASPEPKGQLNLDRPVERHRPIQLRRRFELGNPPERRPAEPNESETESGAPSLSAAVPTSDEQRFAKTMAELQRRQVSSVRAEPWGHVVPRPAAPRRDESVAETTGIAKTRPLGLLWGRMKRSGSGTDPTG